MVAELTEQEVHRVYRAIETVREGISLLNDDGEFIHVNEAYADIFGYDPDDMVGVDWETLGIEANPDYFYNEIWPELVDEGQWNGTTKCVRSDGSTFRAQHSLTYTDDDKIICVLNDLSERRSQIQNLLDVQAELEATTTTASVGVWTWDITEDQIVADTALAQLFGIAPEAAHRGIAPHHVMASIHDEDHAHVEETVTDTIKSGGDFEVEFRVHDGGDGDIRWLVAHGKVETDDTGNTTHIHGAISDVTAQKQVTEELRWTEEKLRLALRAGQLGAWELDLRTEESPSRTPEHDRIFGYEEPIEDWGFERFIEHVHPDDRDAVQQSFETARETGETWDFECRITRADGERRWISAQGEFYYDEDGTPRRAIGVVEDITDRKKRKAELNERNERLERFASMLAHELRNPVNIGQIYSQQLSSECNAEAVEYVTEAFDRIEDMIDVLLVLARGREAVGERTSIDLATMTHEVWDQMETPDATLNEEIDSAIHADETYLRHLFENLFENAIEHGGAAVTVTVGDLPDGFYVADDGTGIPAGEREAIFEAGYTTAADHGGTGLGLAFVRELAEVYGWEYTVTESAAGGARFEFRSIT